MALVKTQWSVSLTVYRQSPNLSNGCVHNIYYFGATTQDLESLSHRRNTLTFVILSNPFGCEDHLNVGPYPAQVALWSSMLTSHHLLHIFTGESERSDTNFSLCLHTTCSPANLSPLSSYQPASCSSRNFFHPLFSVFQTHPLHL